MPQPSRPARLIILLPAVLAIEIGLPWLLARLPALVSQQHHYAYSPVELLRAGLFLLWGAVFGWSLAVLILGQARDPGGGPGEAMDGPSEPGESPDGTAALARRALRRTPALLGALVALGAMGGLVGWSVRLAIPLLPAVWRGPWNALGFLLFAALLLRLAPAVGLAAGGGQRFQAPAPSPAPAQSAPLPILACAWRRSRNQLPACLAILGLAWLPAVLAAAAASPVLSASPGMAQGMGSLAAGWPALAWAPAIGFWPGGVEWGALAGPAARVDAPGLALAVAFARWAGLALYARVSARVAGGTGA